MSCCGVECKLLQPVCSACDSNQCDVISQSDRSNPSFYVYFIFISIIVL